jgi:hypothetical protein
MKAYLWSDGIYRTNPEYMSQEKAEKLFAKAFGVYMDECYKGFHQPEILESKITDDLINGPKIINKAIKKAGMVICGGYNE